MGFFDNVSKKKESPPPYISGLPPPPPPEKKAKADMPLPALIPPPAPPTIEKKAEDKGILSPPPLPPPVIISPAPPVLKTEIKETSPVKTESSFTEEAFTLPNLPKKNLQIPSIPKETKEPKAPDILPLMPRISNFQREEELEVFSDVYEEVPFFNETPELEGFPVLSISDSESGVALATNIAKNGPLFIRTDNYSNVLSVVDSINDYIELSSDMISSIENLKKNAAVEHGKYKTLMEDIQRKLIYIDKMLFEKGVA